MTEKSRKLPETASQTAGPYVHIGMNPNFAGISGCWPQDLGAHPFAPDAAGQHIVIFGRVTDGSGEAAADVVIESWQADHTGEFSASAQGFGRWPVNQANGEFRIATVKPGAIGNQAPHLALWIVARGINMGLQTRLYFSDENNTADPVLQAVPEARRATLVARAWGDGTYQFDIRLQGTDETVFFDM